MEILVIDIETGVIDPKKDPFDIDNNSICEIGVVKLNLDTGDIQTIFNRTCQDNHMCSPSSWVFQNTSLTHDEVTASEHIHDLKDVIQDILNKNPVTSWSHDFDISLLEHPSRSFIIPVKFWDPKITLKNFLKIPQSLGYGYKWPKVQEAFEYFNPEKRYEQTHRAIQDARMSAEIIFQAVEKWAVLRNKWEEYV